MISPTFSSTAPTGWNLLPLEVKEKFYSIAAKGDWTAYEAYDHLVPDTLKDNPEEVVTWMDGGTVSFEVDDYNRGRAGTTSEQVEVEIPDRDVSRIEAGGDYSPENTIMEDMSVNRSRGGVDMTASEFEAAEAANATDTTLIENAFESASESTADVLTSAAADTGSFAGDLGEAVLDGILPVVGAVKAAQFVSNKFDDETDKLGFGALAAGGGALLMCSPMGAPIALGWGVFSIFKLVGNVINRMEHA